MLSSKHAVTVCIALAAAVAVVTAATSARVVLEPLAHHPHGWSRGPRAAADGLHNVAIGLRRAVDDAVLVDELEAVSTPGSPRYGQHLSRAEVEALSTPAPGCEAVVRAWLEPLDGAAVDVAGHGDWLRVSGAPLGALEALIEAEFYEWSHPLRATHAPLVRASAYTVPATVAACVRIVDNVKMLPTIRERTVRTVPAGAPQEIYGVTPQLLREVWNVPSGLVGNSTNGQIMAAAEFNAGDNYAPDDLAAFLKKWKLPSDLAVARVIGGNNPKQPSIECDMDVQEMIGMNQGTEMWLMNNGPDGFLQWLVNITALSPQPLVHSLSYGEDADTLDLAYMDAINAEIIKISSMGASFLVATGDYGVNCLQNPVRQVPTFPAGSPYATAVGGATCGVSDKGVCTHAIESDAITGSGFSNQFPMPSWGKAVMSAYVANNTPPPAHTSFNITGRAYPDIVSLSEDFEFYWKGDIGFTGGTSCAAPVMSAMIALVNDARLAAKLPPLGWLNPLLYQLGTTQPNVYVDITAGPRNSQGNCEGFSPAPGWDAVSGWGGLNFTTFSAAAVAAAKAH